MIHDFQKAIQDIFTQKEIDEMFLYGVNMDPSYKESNEFHRLMNLAEKGHFDNSTLDSKEFMKKVDKCQTEQIKIGRSLKKERLTNDSIIPKNEKEKYAYLYLQEKYRLLAHKI